MGGGGDGKSQTRRPRGARLGPWPKRICVCVWMCVRVSACKGTHVVPGVCQREATEEVHVNQKSSRSTRCSRSHQACRKWTFTSLLATLTHARAHTRTHTHTHACRHKHKGFLQRAIHSTQTAAQTAKLLYAVATLDLHTMRISFKERREEHVNPPGLRDKLPFLFIRPHFRCVTSEPSCPLALNLFD